MKWPADYESAALPTEQLYHDDSKPHILIEFTALSGLLKTILLHLRRTWWICLSFLNQHKI